MSEPAPPTSKLKRYLGGNAWAHAALLFGTLIFMIPFIYMLSTSVKVDEELPDQTVLPRIPTFRGASPYLRPLDSVTRPTDAPADVWDRLSPSLVDRAKAKAEMSPRSPAAEKVDSAAVALAAANQLTTDLSARINSEAWKQGDAAVQAAFDELLTADAVRGAIEDRVARLELRRIQFRTLDAHIETLATGADLAGQLRVESASGAASQAGVVRSGDAALVDYRFADASSPVTVAYDFTLPVAFDRFHKLIVSLQADDSWHGLDASLEVDGTVWRSQRTTSLAQNRPMSVTLQPPTFDDETDRARTWVPLRADKPVTRVAPAGSKATLRLTIDPRGTTSAVGAKVVRNYQTAFLAVPFWKYTFNSVLLVVLSMAGSLFSASFIAYAFARLHWPGRSFAFMLVLSTMMLPGQVTMIPSFMIWKSLGWYNTLNPMWVGAWFGSAFFIFLMVQHMRTIPKELEEAARIDGLNALQAWYYVILPQLKPTLAAISVMTFMGAWNEFMGPLIYLRDQDKFPLSLGLFALRLDQGGDWTLVMAGSVLMTLPVIVVFFLCQRYFIQGVTLTGMKG